MPVPKKRKSPARRDRRRAHHDRVDVPSLTYCANPDCGAPVLPHHVCGECGQYRGESVIEVLTPEEIEAKRKERREQVKAQKAGRFVPPAAEKKKGKAEAEDEEEKR